MRDSWYIRSGLENLLEEGLDEAEVADDTEKKDPANVRLQYFVRVFIYKEVLQYICIVYGRIHMYDTAVVSTWYNQVYNAHPTRPPLFD